MEADKGTAGPEAPVESARVNPEVFFFTGDNEFVKSPTRSKEAPDADNGRYFLCIPVLGPERTQCRFVTLVFVSITVTPIRQVTGGGRGRARGEAGEQEAPVDTVETPKCKYQTIIPTRYIYIYLNSRHK